MTVPTIAARHAHAILDAAAHAGLDTTALLEAAGIDQLSVGGADARIPLAAQTRLWREAVRLTGDDAFAVRLGGSVAPGRYGVLEPLLLSCPTLGEAIQRYMRLERLSVDGAVTTLVLSGREAIISHGPRLPGYECSPYGVEMTLAAIVTIARTATMVPIVPRAVRLQRHAPDDATEYVRVFRSRVQFGADDDALVLDRALLDQPLRNADAELAEALDRFASQQLAKLPPLTDEVLEPRVTAWLQQAVVSGTPGMSEAARALAVSERTLQRRLQSEGTTFAALCDAVRRERALEQARDPRVSMDVVALLAGFAEKRAFYRAFRRWTGVTPAAYRATHQASPERGQNV